MTRIKVNKTEAACRQINAAVRMLFANEDPVAIYTLSCAALRILRDIAEKRHDSLMNQMVEKIIQPNMKKEFWKTLNAPANFLKHAEKDPDAILDNLEEEANDITLLLACIYYKDLGNQLTPEMMAMVVWCMAIHPDLIRDDTPGKAFAEQQFSHLKTMSRLEQLSEGQKVLQLARNQPCRL